MTERGPDRPQPPDSSTARAWLIGLALFTSALIVALWRLQAGSTTQGLRVSTPWFLEDFRDAVYYPTQAFWHGINPYDATAFLSHYSAHGPFSGYAPATFLVFSPLALLSLSVASAAWLFLNLGGTLLLAAMGLRLASLKVSAPAVAGLAGALLLSRPGQWNLLLGQVTLVPVLAVYAAVTLRVRAPPAAGLAIALSQIKPTFGLPLVVLLAGCRAWRALGWGAAFTAVINLPVLIAVARAGGVGPFVEAAFESQRQINEMRGNTPLTNFWRVDAVAVASALIGRPLAWPAAGLLSLAVLAIGVAGARRLLRANTMRRESLLTGVICCAILLSVYHKAYDLLLLTLPATTLVSDWRKALVSRPELVVCVTALAGLALNYLSSESFAGRTNPSGLARGFLLTINGIGVAVLMLAYLTAIWRRPVSPE